MIFAAGLGTRLRPLTNGLPKALIKINNKTLLELVIQKLKRFGFDEIIINIHHQADKITEFLKSKNNFEIKIETCFEKNLLNTGGGLKNAQKFFSDKKPFLIHNIDVLSDFDLKKAYQKHLQSKALVSLLVQKRKTSRYLIFNEKNNLIGWKNSQTNQEKIIKNSQEKRLFGFTGIQVVDPKVFSLMPNKESFSIIEFYLNIALNNNVKAIDCSNKFWLDVGKKSTLERAKKNI